MPARWLVLALLPVGLAGCAPERVPGLEYLPPSGLPAPERSAYVRQPPFLVWSSVVDRLQQQGFELARLDERTRQLVVDYSGDPEPYVDCGWIVVDHRRGVEGLPASQAAATFERRGDDVRRRLHLEARMKVEVEPIGDHAVVRAGTTYVLTKTVEPVDGAQAYPLHEEAITFATGETAAFPVGTTCQPNGRYERLVFDALPPTSIAER